MKDYTKYDFNAIIGAEADVMTTFFSNRKGKVLCGWEHEGKPYLLIVVCKPNGSHLCDIPLDEITSLTARIKVEDMSGKQLKRLLGTYQTPGIEHIFVIAENGVHHSIMTTWEEVGKQDFADYIDCTDWGWEK